MIKVNKQKLAYILSDYIFTLLTWILFSVVRYYKWTIYEDGYSSLTDYLCSPMLIKEYLILPLCWLTLFYFSGYYNVPLRKSRLSEFFQTLGSVLLGALVIFFAVLLNDLPLWYELYYKLFAVLLTATFMGVYIPRFILTQRATVKIQTREWAFSALIIGTGNRANELYRELEGRKLSLGYSAVGFVKSELDTPNHVAADPAMIVGEVDQLTDLISKYKIQELLVAIDIQDPTTLYTLLSKLYPHQLPIRLMASSYDIIVGGVRMTTIMGMPLVDISRSSFPEWQKNIKFFLDKVIALVALVITSPILLYATLRIKLESKGAILYQQERIGLHGVPFSIYKLRTMYTDSEAQGPQLSANGDKRITPFGRVLRKYRIDELPQFWNVLIGDMTLVGPRAERAYFIEQIHQVAPYYSLVHRVRPGITSWGMVKYGYADSVDKMVERLDYDIIYLDNMSLMVDLKIMIYTVSTILKGEGV